MPIDNKPPDSGLDLSIPAVGDTMASSAPEYSDLTEGDIAVAIRAFDDPADRQYVDRIFREAEDRDIEAARLALKNSIARVHERASRGQGE